MPLAILVGGLLTAGAAVSGKKELAIGGGIILIALLVLYAAGKEDRAKVEKELAQLPPEEQDYWRPVLDTPEAIPLKLRDRMIA